MSVGSWGLYTPALISFDPVRTRLAVRSPSKYIRDSVAEDITWIRHPKADVVLLADGRPMRSYGTYGHVMSGTEIVDFEPILDFLAYTAAQYGIDDIPSADLVIRGWLVDTPTLGRADRPGHDFWLLDNLGCDVFEVKEDGGPSDIPADAAPLAPQIHSLTTVKSYKRPEAFRAELAAFKARAHEVTRSVVDPLASSPEWV